MTTGDTDAALAAVVEAAGAVFNTPGDRTLHDQVFNAVGDVRAVKVPVSVVDTLDRTTHLLDIFLANQLRPDGVMRLGALGMRLLVAVGGMHRRSEELVEPAGPKFGFKDHPLGTLTIPDKLYPNFQSIKILRATVAELRLGSPNMAAVKLVVQAMQKRESSTPEGIAWRSIRTNVKASLFSSNESQDPRPRAERNEFLGRADAALDELTLALSRNAERAAPPVPVRGMSLF